MSAGEQFRSAMRAAGLDYAGPIRADGKRGFEDTWCDRNGQLSKAEWDSVTGEFAKAPVGAAGRSAAVRAAKEKGVRNEHG